MQYRTKEDDMLDRICWKHYGHEAGTVELVLTANPGLASHGPRLPGGLLINLPEISVVQADEPIRLWD
jgi:phage tail protein X